MRKKSGLYDCEANTSEKPEAIQSYNDFKFQNDLNSQPEVGINADSDISLSPWRCSLH